MKYYYVPGESYPHFAGRPLVRGDRIVRFRAPHHFKKERNRSRSLPIPTKRAILIDQNKYNARGGLK